MTPFEYLMIGTQVIVGLFITVFLPTYIKKKAENIAQKEDLEEITRSVEQIKHEFGLKNEELKAELSLITSSRLDHKRYSRDAIVLMAGCLNDWYHIHLNIGDVTFFKDSEDVKLKIIQIKHSASEASKQSSMLTLVVQDQEYLLFLFDTISKLMDYSHTIENYLQKLSQQMYMKEKLIMNNPNQNTMIESEKIEFMKKYDAIHSQMVSDRGEFSSDAKILMRPASLSLTEFAARSKNKLEEILN